MKHFLAVRGWKVTVPLYLQKMPFILNILYLSKIYQPFDNRNLKKNVKIKEHSGINYPRIWYISEVYCTLLSANCMLKRKKKRTFARVRSMVN